MKSPGRIFIKSNTNLFQEPDSLANLVTNLNVAKCVNAESAYKTLVTYAMEKLNLLNVAMYLDAGHAGWLSWAGNITPAAQLFGTLYANAGKPAAVRVLATNVANYDARSISTRPSYKRYINALAPPLATNGFLSHFIMDICISQWVSYYHEEKSANEIL